MNENFAVQTLGRIRRMPEAKHYNNDVLDYSDDNIAELADITYTEV